MKFLVYLSCFWILAAITVFAPTSSSISQEQGCQRIVASGPPVWPPHILLNAQTNIRSGTAFELSEHIFSDLGVEFVQDQVKPWKRVLRDLKAGEIDLIVTLLDDVQRRQNFEYSIAWTNDVYGVVSRKGTEFQYNGVESLKNYMGAYYSGIRLPPPLNKIKGSEYTVAPVSVISNLYRMLDEERVAYLVVSVDSFFRLMPEEYSRDNFVIVEASKVSLPVYMAFSRQSPCRKYLPQLNTALETYKTQSKKNQSPDN
ncbi:substrate-binding periplasmic protein [Sneathiella limimaris]|uniref:substrate-binding periplasmic protein n=1 Tax=Sneathiella limimaris TaxID=1964213 RepID=UPI00146B7D23|nr:transporter substrate-binding domain-containing protein [Sneathiella limimaris]